MGNTKLQYTITVEELRNCISIDTIKSFISSFKFGRNGACDTIAEMIGKDVQIIGGIESAYFDCVDDKSAIRFLYERRCISNGNIPHRIIELFEATDDMRYIGMIDLPYTLYEECEDRNDSLYWTRNEKFRDIDKNSLFIELCKPQQFSPTMLAKFGLI